MMEVEDLENSSRAESLRSVSRSRSRSSAADSNYVPSSVSSEQLNIDQERADDLVRKFIDGGKLSNLLSHKTLQPLTYENLQEKIISIDQRYF